MEWKTKISNFTEEESTIRGFDHENLIGKISFSSMIYLLLKGRMPNENESKLLDAIFVSCIDHGIAPPSIISARSVASGGNSLNSSVAAGIMALGDYHGGAIEDAAKLFSSTLDVSNLVKKYLDKKIRLPGFGHKIYKESDPRTKKLFALAQELGLAGKYSEIAFQVENEIFKQKGKKFCLNVDGMIAALVLDLGFNYTTGKIFFIISRTPGICAHVHEEITEEKPFRRLKINQTKYIGN